MNIFFLLLLIVFPILANSKGSSSRGGRGSSADASHGVSNTGSHVTRGGYGVRSGSGLVSVTHLSYNKPYTEKASIYVVNRYPWYIWLVAGSNGNYYREHQNDTSSCVPDNFTATVDCLILHNSTDCDNTPSNIVEIVDNCFPKCNSNIIDSYFLNITANISEILYRSCNITIGQVLYDVINDSYEDSTNLIIMIIFVVFGFFILIIVCCFCVSMYCRYNNSNYSNY